MRLCIRSKIDVPAIVEATDGGRTEAVAFVVCTANGIDCRDQSRDYIHLYNGDAKLLLKSMNRIQQTAAKILDLMEERPRAEKKTLHTIDGNTNALAIAA